MNDPNATDITPLTREALAERLSRGGTVRRVCLRGGDYRGLALGSTRFEDIDARGARFDDAQLERLLRRRATRARAFQRVRRDAVALASRAACSSGMDSVRTGGGRFRRGRPYPHDMDSLSCIRHRVAGRDVHDRLSEGV
jgi:hypothetical protein